MDLEMDSSLRRVVGSLTGSVSSKFSFANW